MSTSSIKSQIAPADYERIRAYLQHTIPGGTPGTDKFAPVDDQLVDGFIKTLWRDYKPAYAQLGVPPPPSDYASGPPANKGLRYYAVDARHHRHGFSEFTATIPMVRLPLPSEAQDYKIATAIGDVIVSDHLLRNLQDVVSKAYPCERVELITPARRDGVRFAAIAVLLAYEKFSDNTPKYYILEAGLAQGAPRMSYISSSMAPMVRRSDYLPTQFSSPNNYYRGTLAMDGDQVLSLTIDSMTHDPRKDPSATPYITITATFTEVDTFDRRLDVAPVELYREAVVRVAALADAMGQKVADLSFLQGMFAQDGMQLDWLAKPPPGGAAK
jgi:hypothetical protein